MPHIIPATALVRQVATVEAAPSARNAHVCRSQTRQLPQRPQESALAEAVRQQAAGERKAEALREFQVRVRQRVAAIARMTDTAFEKVQMTQ